jgi:hypothetical protein
MTISRRRIAAACAAVVLTAGAAVEGHHSNVTFFDFDKTIEVTGTVVLLRLINPHINLRIEVMEPNGQKTMWTFDGPNASASRANGWHQSILTPGEKVTVVAHPARNPEFKGGYGERVIKEGGKTLDFGGSAAN